MKGIRRSPSWPAADTNHDIRVRGFDAAGVQTFAAVDVDGAADSDVVDPSITALANGSFVVAWENVNPILPDTSRSIRARIVTANGVLIGSEFTINTDTTGEQQAPNLAALPNGGFVAVYASDGDIRGQVFDAFGARDGGEFVVNSSTDDLQFAPTVAALADGRFVVTWGDSSIVHPDDPSDSGVRQQIFDPRDGLVIGTNNAETLFGHDLGSDEINGLGGADTLNGLGGADNLYGGDGDDTYVAGAGDTVFEFSGAGKDLVQAAVSFTLGDNVENLTLTGAAAAGTGNAAVNTITGNAAANALNGLGGADTMLGLAGNDSYTVDNALDTVSEAGGSGVDTVISSIAFNLTPSVRVIGAFEKLTLIGTTNINGTGNTSANTLVGNGGVNVLSGLSGNDIISAGVGNDTLIGGVGIDTLTGGVNNDSFVFNAPLSAANRDTVTDFNHVNDVFRLENGVMAALGGAGPLNPNFFFAGAAAHDPNDHVIYNKVTGALFFDSNGIAAGGVTQLATLTNRPTNVAANDFAVI